jgi:hypothetical protein
MLELLAWHTLERPLFRQHMLGLLACHMLELQMFHPELRMIAWHMLELLAWHTLERPLFRQHMLGLLAWHMNILEEQDMILALHILAVQQQPSSMS